MLVIVTVAEETTLPCSSVTVPRKAPVSVCAHAAGAKPDTSIKQLIAAKNITNPVGIRFLKKAAGPGTSVPKICSRTRIIEAPPKISTWNATGFGVTVRPPDRNVLKHKTLAAVAQFKPPKRHHLKTI